LRAGLREPDVNLLWSSRIYCKVKMKKCKLAEAKIEKKKALALLDLKG
jgi:hypothetical protein